MGLVFEAMNISHSEIGAFDEPFKVHSTMKWIWPSWLFGSINLPCSGLHEFAILKGKYFGLNTHNYQR